MLNVVFKPSRLDSWGLMDKGAYAQKLQMYQE